MAGRTDNRLYPRILDEASEWFVDFGAGDVDARGRAAFNQWLRRSPDHVRAYLQVSALWEDAEALHHHEDADAVTLLAKARADANVVALEAAAAAPVQTAAPRRWPAALAASIAILGLAAGTLVWLQHGPGEVFETRIGEQRSIALADGSTLELNSRSRVRVRYTDHQRGIELMAGQALFDVAADPARPFVVMSGGMRVQAVGTQFDVYRRESGTTVTVVEGKVAVLSPESGAPPTAGASSPQPVFVSAGEQVLVAPDARTAPRPANIAAATAWTQRKLVFESTPLSEVVAEFNRYNARPVTIADPGLEGFHISGVFPSTDSAQLIRFLRQRFDIRVHESAGGVSIAR